MIRREERIHKAALAMTLGQSLTDILAEYPGGVLAGGALRDTMLGLPVKDYDIFVPVWEGTLPDDDPVNGIANEEWQQRKSKYGSINAIFVKTVKYADQTFDIIHVYPDRTAENDFAQWVIDRFDFGICKVAYDPAGGLLVSPQFWDDVNLKTLTLRTESLGWESHYARLQEKFPEYRFVNGAAFTEMGRVQSTHGFGITQ